MAILGSVANLLFREFCSLQVIELPMSGFRILPPKLKFATEPVDMPEASLAIVLSGTGSRREYVQRLGRILRRREGKHALLYEVVPEATSEEQVSRRRRQRPMVRPSRPLEVVKPDLFADHRVIRPWPREPDLDRRVIDLTCRVVDPPRTRGRDSAPATAADG
jgi:hypothetical protein